MVFPDEATKIILTKFPGFETYHDYQEYSEWYKNGEVSYYMIMTAFSRYVIDVYIKNQDDEMLKEIFSMIENFVIHGNDELQGASVTCFLENLVNVSSHGDFSPSIFVPYLGKESRKYCKAWDEFTGVKTEGL